MLKRMDIEKTGVKIYESVEEAKVEVTTAEIV